MDLMHKLCKKFIDDGRVPKDQLNDIAIALDCAFAIGMVRKDQKIEGMTINDFIIMLQGKFDTLKINEVITRENLLNE